MLFNLFKLFYFPRITKVSCARELVGIVAACLIAFSSSVTANQGGNQQQVSQLKKDIKQLESQLHSFQKKEGGLVKQLRKMERDAANLHQQLRVTQQKIVSTETRLSNLAIEQQRLDKDKQKQQVVLANQLDSAFRMGRQDQMKVLLNQQDPNLVSRTMKYYEYLNESRVQAIKNYQSTIQELQQVEVDIRQSQAELSNQQQQLQNKSEQLADSRRQRQDLLKALKEKIANTDGRLKADRERLQSLVKRLRKTLDKNDLNWESKSFRQLKGKLSWPTSGKLLSRFGTRSHQGISSEGIVIGAPAGRNVKAIHHGRVVFSDWLRGYGLLIIVDHGSGYMSLYGHNQTLTKTVGDWVNGNEVIATVGDTGGHQKSGLYFAIRHQGKPYNPRSWLSKSRG